MQLDSQTLAPELTEELDSEGIILLPQLLSAEQLASLRVAFQSRLSQPRWNDVDGYEKTERFRHMVQDVLTLDQACVDLALHALVKEILHQYIGENFALCEAKGWKSLPTKKDFHGWHGDAWYEQSQTSEIPREVKMAIYLTDVRSGAFQYIRGSHSKEHPRSYRLDELAEMDSEKLTEVTGPAGSVFMFDTSGIHRQGIPILEPREAIFLNYHDPTVPLQQEDVEYYRYHPLILNAAFLGGLGEDDMRILGFGDQANFQHAFVRQTRFTRLHGSIRRRHNVAIYLDALWERWSSRFSRLFHR